MGWESDSGNFWTWLDEHNREAERLLREATGGIAAKIDRIESDPRWQRSKSAGRDKERFLRQFYLEQGALQETFVNAIRRGCHDGCVDPFDFVANLDRRVSPGGFSFSLDEKHIDRVVMWHDLGDGNMEKLEAGEGSLLGPGDYVTASGPLNLWTGEEFIRIVRMRSLLKPCELLTLERGSDAFRFIDHMQWVKDFDGQIEDLPK